MSSILVRIHEFAVASQDHGVNASRIGGNVAVHPDSDVIEVIAESLIENASGSERKLLSKSLQEALFYCVDVAAEIDYAQFKTRFARHVNRHGASSVAQRFLSLYFFNFVWYHTGESFRALAEDTDSFANDIESVEHLCQRVVASTWESFEPSKQPTSLSAAKELVHSIEQQLRGA